MVGAPCPSPRPSPRRRGEGDEEPSLPRRGRGLGEGEGRPFVARRIFFSLIALCLSWPALAQLAEPHPAPAPSQAGPQSGLEQPGHAARGETGDATAGEQHRLPPDSTTRHTLELPGRTLRFTATAGSIRLDGRDGKPQAEIAYVAYALEGADPAARPVSFALNGGPGMASAWLHLGGLGPWRLPMHPEALSPSATPAVVDNTETWLDFTDLVFIDPAGTGYSRLIDPSDEARRRFFSVDGDIGSLAEFVRRWLEANNRVPSPKFFVGESYGAFRGPPLVRNLESEQGIGIGGMVLLSPVLDFQMLTSDDNPLWWVARLPSMAAAARAATGAVERAWLADAESYAAGDYLRDLLRGWGDAAAVARMSARVAELTGLDPGLVRRRGGRIDAHTFDREFYRPQGRIGSAYDATVTTADPDPSSESGRYADPFLQGLSVPLTSAMLDLYASRLAWHPEGQYRLANSAAYEQWNWGRGLKAPEALDSLRRVLALDSQLHVLVEQGLTDLVTPYFGTELLLHQLPDFGPGRVRFVVHPGGHMFYLRDASRAALRDEAQAMIGGR